MNTGEPAQRIGKVNVHNVVRLRADAWNRMRDFTKRLSSPFDLPDEAQRSLVAQVEELFTFLATYERFFAFPGARILAHLRSLFVAAEFDDLAAACVRVARLRTTGGYRRIDLTTTESSDFLSLVSGAGLLVEPAKNNNRPYFELLVVDEMSAAEQIELRSQLHAFRTDADEFVYEVVVVSSLEDALLATMINRGIQAVVPRFSFPLGTGKPADMLTAIYTMLGVTREELNDLLPGERTAQLGAMVKGLRPELDAYRITDASVEVAVASDSANAFNRHFYQTEDYLDLHVSILKGVHDRYETPFFDALRRYSLRPTGMFHALPVSRGRTIARSHWITDFGEFYGPRLFLAETSATTGGLDSLLQPTGSLKRAQELASRAFGSDHTFFVTNGTSTANKIVMQALVRPGVPTLA